MARVSFKSVSPRGFTPRDHTAYRLAHFPTHVFFTIESKQDGHQGDARVASSCVQPGHIGHVYPGSHSTEATSPKQRHSSFAGVHNGCWLRPVCSDVFLLCACSKMADQCENTDSAMRCICVDERDLCLFCAYVRRKENRKLLKRIGVPDGI